MRRAHARKAEQRRQGAAAWLARVCSALTHEVMDIVGGNVCIHALCPAESSGQLRFLGLLHLAREQLLLDPLFDRHQHLFLQLDALGGDGQLVGL